MFETLDYNRRNEIIRYDLSSSDQTVYLPPLDNGDQNLQYTLVADGNGNNTHKLTINGNGATIDGQSTLVLLPGQWAKVSAMVSNAKTWKSLIGGPTANANLITNGLLSASLIAPKPHRIVTLLSGCDDETVSSAVNCTTAADTTNYKLGDRGLQITMSGATTAQVIWDPLSPIQDPYTFPPASGIGCWLYIADPTKITSFSIDIYSDAGLTTKWTRSPDVALQTGWNLLRWPAVAGVTTGWGTIWRVRLVIVTNAATTLTLGHLFAECPPKAQILFIEDGGYVSFLNNGYPDLKARGLPITWAIDPGLLASSSGATQRISEADVATVANDGNNNAIGFHAWDSTTTSGMTAAQLRAETMKSLKWLKSRGYSGGLWRAAFLQNSATNHAAIQSLVLAYATPTSTASLTVWPPTPTTRWNIPRIALHGLSQAQMDAYFATLQVTHGLMVVYTHYIDNAGGTNTTQANWDHFLSLIDAGLSAGWLEGVTFEQLFTHSGGRVVSTLGDTVIEYYDNEGVRQQTRLP